MRVNERFFTIERAVKVYVHTEAAIEAFIQASIDLNAKQPILFPLSENEGQLEKPLALPTLIEVDATGEKQPASKERWQSFIAGRLLSPGMHRLGEQIIWTPSLAYNQAFLKFHLDQGQTERAQREGVGYLRSFLLAQLTIANETRKEEDARLWLDTLNWLEPYSKQLKTKVIVNKRFTIKHKTLAYRLLIEYGYISLDRPHDTAQQAAYIVAQTKSDKRTIERYLISNLSAHRAKSNKNFIYSEEGFERALQYINDIMPTIVTDTFRLDTVFRSRKK